MKWVIITCGVSTGRKVVGDDLILSLKLSCWLATGEVI